MRIPKYGVLALALGGALLVSGAPDAAPAAAASPCVTQTTTGAGVGPTTTTHDLGLPSGTLTFAYHAFMEPDQFQIYRGSDTSGRLLYSSGVVTGDDTVTVRGVGSRQITVVVTGGTTGTQWQYTVTAPAGCEVPV